jgi:PAS domain S-box-containing protein
MTVGENGQPDAAEGAVTTVEADGVLTSRLLGALRQHAVFALDDAGCVTSWNAAAERLTGYAESEVRNRPCDLLIASRDPRSRRHILDAAAKTGTWHGESWWRRADGRLIRVDEVIHPMDAGGFVVVARDVSADDGGDGVLHAAGVRETAGLDREQTLRHELQAADRRASFLAEASSILVATSLDFDSTVKALSRLAVSRLAEWCVIHTIDDQDQLHLTEVAHRDPAIESVLSTLLDETIHASWESAIRSVIHTGQAQALEHSVEDRWFKRPADDQQAALLARVSRGDVMATPLLGRGRILGAITFVAAEDTTFDDADLLLAEELGRRAAMALDNARLFREAQEADRAKADFLAVISHELRTPLNAIMGYSDLLDAEISGDLTDKQRRQIGRIRASARHLLQLIEEILAFARIQSGGDELRLELADATEIMNEAAAVAEPMARAKGLEFSVEIDGGPVTLETDAGKARQVLVNLLANAVKFTDSGAVTLRMRRSSHHVIFEVADTGVGIAPSQIGRIYDPFWQAEHPNTRKAGGTGLGLSVSRRYARLLHGALDVRSEPGRGATFIFTLPLRITGPGQAERDSRAP